MSILDKYPPPWTLVYDCKPGEDPEVSHVVDSHGVKVLHDQGDARSLMLAAPRLLRALANIVVMVDGPEQHRKMAISDAEALIAEIEGDG